MNNLVNPKMIPFFIALFPQFIDPLSGSVALQSLTLGVTLALIGVLCVGLEVLVVDKFRVSWNQQLVILELANKFASITFFGLGLGLRLATEQE